MTGAGVMRHQEGKINHLRGQVSDALPISYRMGLPARAGFERATNTLIPTSTADARQRFDATSRFSPRGPIDPSPTPDQRTRPRIESDQQACDPTISFEYFARYQ